MTYDDIETLLKETEAVLARNGKTDTDVLWVGSRDGEFSCTWDQFTRFASVEYDRGYGAAKVAQDLVVVGQGWWLERGEYDGSEWWEYQQAPQQATETKAFFSVVVPDSAVGWWSLSELVRGWKFHLDE